MTLFPTSPAGGGPPKPSTCGEFADKWAKCENRSTAKTRGDFLKLLALYAGPDCVSQLFATGQVAGNRILDAFLAWMRDKGLAAGTCELRLASARSLLSAGRRAGLARWEPERAARPTNRPAMQIAQGLASNDLARLLQAAARSVFPTRDRAFILLLANSGLRRTALAALDVADLVREGNSVSGFWMKEKGKPGQKIMHSLDRKTADAVSRWAAERGDEPGPLLGISSDGVYAVCRRLALDAGLTGRLSPGVFRYSAGDLANNAFYDVEPVKHAISHVKANAIATYLDQPQT